VIGAEHVRYEIGPMGLDTGNVTVIVDIATAHLDIFLMMDTKIQWWFGRFHFFVNNRNTWKLPATVSNILITSPSFFVCLVCMLYYCTAKWAKELSTNNYVGISHLMRPT